ncbi:MAG: helix-hairpin-helix domain-containing protein [bacterium]
MERSLTRTHKYLLAFFIVLMIAGGLFRLYHAGAIGKLNQKKDIEFITLPQKTARVHVKGEVANPGVYTLESGARWIDAVEAAGGFTDDADRTNRNMARYLRDGQEVVVPRVEYEKLPAGGSAGGSGGTQEPEEDKVEPGEFVNINTAGEDELMRLPGVGPVLASRIIETRNTRGPFAKKQELMLVPGIGRQKYLQLEMYLVVKSP